MGHITEQMGVMTSLGESTYKENPKPRTNFAAYRLVRLCQPQPPPAAPASMCGCPGLPSGGPVTALALLLCELHRAITVNPCNRSQPFTGRLPVTLRIDQVPLV